MQPIFSIAIDGPAGAGKSTIARKLAERLGAIYLDTGAMYRTVALYMHDSDIQGSESIARAINDPKIEVQFQNGEQHMLLNGVDVNERLRSPEASMMASRVSAVPAVRERLVALQREIAAGHAVVMDGRDIGLKVYLTASCEVRADRRFAELKEDNPTLTREQVLADIVERDYNDAHREASPLYQASDAVRIDTSNMNQDQVVAAIIDLLLKALRA